jgi:chemotaxis signal transduction protein
MSETVRLEANRTVVPIPSGRPELLGLCGVRGQLVPVYSLSALLGYGTERPGRWLALCCATWHPNKAKDNLVGLSFDDVEGYLTPSHTALHPVRLPDGIRKHVVATVTFHAHSYSIISIASIMEVLRPRPSGVPPASGPPTASRLPDTLEER